MVINQLFLIISLIGFIICVALSFHYLYSYNGNRKYKTIILSFIIPFLMTLLYPTYTSISNAIYNKRFNTFEVEVNSNFNEVNYLNMYEEIYEKSNASSDLIISKNHKNIKMFLTNDGEFREFSIRVIVPKYNKYFLYTSYFKDGYLVFVASDAIKQNQLGDFYDLYPYFVRINNFDKELVLNSMQDIAYQNGMGIDITLNYYTEPTKIHLVSDPYLDKEHLAIDKDNNLINEKIIEVSKECINIKLSILPKEINDYNKKSYDLIKIFDKEYLYRNKDTIELVNFST